MTEQYEHMKIQELPIDMINVSKDNPRQTFDEDGLRSLGESIKTHGQLQPIIVRPKGDYYELVVGERRLRACVLVGLHTVEARVQEIDDSTSMELRLIENTHREDFTEAEKGNAIAHLLADFPEKYPTIKALAEKLKKHEATVNKWLQQSERLSDFVKKSIQRNKLSVHGVRYLVRFSREEQDKLAKAIIKYGVPKGHDDKHTDFFKQYALNPEKYPTVESLEALANEVKGVKKVKIDLDQLSPEARLEVERKLKEAKEEAKKLREKRPKRKRVNKRRQGRPKKHKTKPQPEPQEEIKPIPEPTIPVDTQIVTIALNFPEPLWEKVNRYMVKTNKPMLLEDAIISLLESHPLLRGL